MKTFIHRRAFTVVELLVVIAVLVAGLTLLLPAVHAARDEDKANQCSNNLKQIGLALLNYEDKRKCLPPISSNIDTVPDVPGDATPVPEADLKKGPGQAATPAAGYSWMVQILPDLEEGILYQSIVTSSTKFTQPAFSPKIVRALGVNEPHPATVDVAVYHCPASTDGPKLDTSARTVGAGKKYESGTLPPNYAGGVATANGAKGLAITNYNAILGTHIDPDKKSASVPNNGGMMFRGPSFDQGRKLAAMTDGTSKVPLVTETNETRFGSWYDGTMNWVVAARHSNPKDGTKPITPVSKFSGQAGNAEVKDRLIVGTDGTSDTGGHALNYGPNDDTRSAVYLPSGALNDPDISAAPPGRLWGASSQHPGGIVYHSFCDGHVSGVSDAMDPNVYLWLVTRNGGEPVQNY
jgi:type II secretory pathway pseudopilin PulG